MPIVTDAPQITGAAARHRQRLVAAAEQVPKELVAVVQPDRIGAQEPAHPRHQIRVRGFQDMMEMVAHQAVGMDSPTGLLTGFGQRLEEIVTIHLVQEDVFPAVAPAHHMVDGPGILNSDFARHAAILARLANEGKRKYAQCDGLTP